MASATDDLQVKLSEVFGFEQFRPHQQAVCADVMQGNDCLLVMPTGSGKSLCYQLPGLMRKGCTIVISPLIALIDDQVAKLRQLGLRAESIHSGRSREQSRQVCIDYAASRLDFLYIAPERLGVPGFVEFLAKVEPALVAVDEAHCISGWGHDFRPDYRMLGARLQQLRSSPLVAVTATATRKVQQDIMSQLGLQQPKCHIHGFRRSNISIECVTLPTGSRSKALQNYLNDPGHLPAIIYVPTRALCAEIAGGLAHDCKVGIYHAGLDKQQRAAVQQAFFQGSLEVIVATVAFGMGVDKANIRTVVHYSLPSSVESYYQEIGRAGRDGEESKALLLYDFADNRYHEFFFAQNYPESSFLEQLLQNIPPEGIQRPDLQFAVGSELTDAGLEKLWLGGAVSISYDDRVTAVPEVKWRQAYEDLRDHKKHQLRLMGRFAAEGSRCRMVRLVEYFADAQDDGRACGHCDVCSPESSSLRRQRILTDSERRWVKAIMDHLAIQPRAMSKGKLHAAITSGVADAISRDDLDDLLAAILRPGWIVVEQQSFMKDGKVIQYTAVRQSANCAGWRRQLDSLMVYELSEAYQGLAAKKKQSVNKTRVPSKKIDVSGLDQDVWQRLKDWRREEAARRKLPAFCVLSDQTLGGICEALPKSNEELLAINGMGKVRVERFGSAILRVLATD